MEECYSCKRQEDPPCSYHRMRWAAEQVHATFPTILSSGGWSVVPFDMSKKEVKWARIRGMINGGAREVYDLEPGHYVKLTCNESLVMSTTPMELRTHREAVERAGGHVIIGGLGLGIIARAIRSLANVVSVTVIERSPHVIGLVAPSLRDGIVVIQGDVFEWTPQDPKARFDFVWLDIWNNVPNSDDWAEMKALRRRWRRWAPAAGAVRCWREEDARSQS